MTAALLPKRIHAIRTRANLKFLASFYKLREFSVNCSPLGHISGVSQYIVYLMVFFVPSHQLCMLFIFEQTFQAWYYRSIPHHLCRVSLPGMFTIALNITRVISRLILYRDAQHIGHASKFSYSPR
jgi:hypothetical protein